MFDDEGLSDFSDMDSSSDEDEVLLEPRQKNENYLEDIVPQYSNEVFWEHFRLSRETATQIATQFEMSRYFHNQPGHYGMLSALDHVLIYLWYIGHQSVSYRDVADRFNVTISSISRIICRMTYFLSNLSRDIIKWPTDPEKRVSQQHFQEKGFPNVIGCIDGSHIKIDKPTNDPDSYINRKGYYSVQMQVVCDHRRKIIDLFVGYPGSVHDSRVYRNSPLSNELEQKCGRYFILGDSGYPLRGNLLTPYKDRGNLTRRQQNYNVKLSSNRYIIEHCFGILKQKFRQMYHVKLRNIRLIVHLIRAACVLHNIALEDEFHVYENEGPINEEVQVNDDDMDDDDDVDIEANAIRNRVANTLRM